LTPQSVFQLGGFKLQGKTEEAERKILAQAKKLEQLGCFGVVLECVPTLLAKSITEGIGIPTIGIGAGPFCDGQVLVWHDLLGLHSPYLKQTEKPKFVREFAQLSKQIQGALKSYCEAVDASKSPSVELKAQKAFPSPSESYYFPKNQDASNKKNTSDTNQVASKSEVQKLPDFKSLGDL
jgi:3-methyl-2-oxobutanoate hydroxymethyltransferase